MTSAMAAFEEALQGTGARIEWFGDVSFASASVDVDQRWVTALRAAHEHVSGTSPACLRRHVRFGLQATRGRWGSRPSCTDPEMPRWLTAHMRTFPGPGHPMPRCAGEVAARIADWRWPYLPGEPFQPHPTGLCSGPARGGRILAQRRVSRIVLDAGMDAWTLSEVRAVGAAIVLGLVVTARRRCFPIRVAPAPLATLWFSTASSASAFRSPSTSKRSPVSPSALPSHRVPGAAVGRAVGQIRAEAGGQAHPVAGAGGDLLRGACDRGWHSVRQLGPGWSGSAFLAGLCFAVYFIVGERLVAEHDPFVVSFWVFDRRRGVVRRGGLWTRITPLWQIDYGQPATLPAALGALVVPMGLLLLWIVGFGTVVPFASETAAMRWVPATTVSVIAMLEPVGSAAIGWWWFDQRLEWFQIFRGRAGARRHRDGAAQSRGASDAGGHRPARRAIEKARHAARGDLPRGAGPGATLAPEAALVQRAEVRRALLRPTPHL